MRAFVQECVEDHIKVVDTAEDLRRYPSECSSSTFYSNCLFDKNSHKLHLVDPGRMWLRTCKYFKRKYENSSPRDLMERTYESHSLYATLKVSGKLNSDTKLYEDGMYYIFNANKTKERRYLRALVPTIASRASCFGVVGYTTDFTSPTLRQEMARIIGDKVDDQWEMHRIYIEYRLIHIPTIDFPESVYTILHNTCFPQKMALPSAICNDGRKGINRAAWLNSIRKKPRNILEELEQLFKSGRKGAMKVLFVLYGIDEMVSFCCNICSSFD